MDVTCPHCRSIIVPRPCDKRAEHKEEVRADFHPQYCSYCPYCLRHGEHW